MDKRNRNEVAEMALTIAQLKEAITKERQWILATLIATGLLATFCIVAAVTNGLG